MRIVDVIQHNKILLSLLSKNGVGTSWVNYLDMHADYQRLTKEGHKKTYIVAYLSEIYGMTERQIFHILKRLDSPVNV